MKVMISIEHPAWVHQFKHILCMLKQRGYTPVILAINKDRSAELLDRLGYGYILVAHTTGRNLLEKGWLFLKLCISYTRWAMKHKPDILIGRASPMMAVAAFLTKRPHLLYEDTEASKFSLFICRLLSTKIITPGCFLADLGKKQKRVPVYKELFYLHPDYFTPNAGMLSEHGLDPQKRYIIVRFVSWNASHDIGKTGLPEKEKLEFVRALSQYADVYVSSESPLSPELEPYRLALPYEMIHHALYFAQIVISEGATVASEAVALGTNAIYLNDIISGTTMEQQDKYRLLYIFRDTSTRYQEALKMADRLLSRTKLWEEGKEKRKTLLADMLDANKYYLDQIDATAGNYYEEK